MLVWSTLELCQEYWQRFTVSQHCQTEQWCTRTLGPGMTLYNGSGFDKLQTRPLMRRISACSTVAACMLSFTSAASLWLVPVGPVHLSGARFTARHACVHTDSLDTMFKPDPDF